MFAPRLRDVFGSSVGDLAAIPAVAPCGNVRPKPACSAPPSDEDAFRETT